MSNRPPDSHPYLRGNAVRSQIWTDITTFSFTQVWPSLIMAVGAFFYAWWTGQVTSVSQGLKFILYSLLAGLLLYLILAVIRAPFLVIGWHLRQISSLNIKLAELQNRGVLSFELPTPKNTFRGFRVLSDKPSKLEFEVWYFYDGALGENHISIYPALEKDGLPVGKTDGSRAWFPIEIINHEALARFDLEYQPTIEKEGPFRSTHVVLTMEHDTKDIVFYRQLIPYEKEWKAPKR